MLGRTAMTHSWWSSHAAFSTASSVSCQSTPSHAHPSSVTDDKMLFSW